MSLQVIPTQIRVNASGLCVLLSAAANRVVEWSASGSAAIVAITSVTDGQGRAYARLLPTVEGTVTVTVKYGA